MAARRTGRGRGERKGRRNGGGEVGVVNKRGKGGEEREMEATGPSTFKALYFPPDFFFFCKGSFEKGKNFSDKKSYLHFLSCINGLC